MEGWTIKKQYQELLEQVSHCGDEEFKEGAATLIASLVDDCACYLGIVVKSETQQRIAKHTVSGAELRNLLAETDRYRTANHNALIGSVKAVNRLCEKLGCEPLYAGGTERRDYGDFALQFVSMIFDVRK